MGRTGIRIFVGRPEGEIDVDMIVVVPLPIEEPEILMNPMTGEDLVIASEQELIAWAEAGGVYQWRIEER